MIDVFSFASLWDEIVADTLDLIDWVVTLVQFLWHSKDTAVRVSTNKNCSGNFLLDFSGNTGHGTSGSNSDYDCVDFSIALVDYLLGQLIVMC